MRSDGRLLASSKLVSVLLLALVFVLQSGNAQPRFMQLTGEIASPAFEGRGQMMTVPSGYFMVT